MIIFLLTIGQDLMAEFSEWNIKYIRQWVLFYRPQFPIGQQPAAQLEIETELEGGDM